MNPEDPLPSKPLPVSHGPKRLFRCVFKLANGEVGKSEPFQALDHLCALHKMGAFWSDVAIPFVFLQIEDITGGPSLSVPYSLDEPRIVRP
jgi:hypothetical protein